MESEDIGCQTNLVTGRHIGQCKGSCTDDESHPSSQRFHKIMGELVDLHDKKQKDYGTDEDPFNNIRSSAKEWGIPAWVGAMLRATDKVRRLQKFADKGELANESVIDAFDDLAVYAVIARVMYEEDKEERKPTIRSATPHNSACGAWYHTPEECGCGCHD